MACEPGSVARSYQSGAAERPRFSCSVATVVQPDCPPSSKALLPRRAGGVGRRPARAAGCGRAMPTLWTGGDEARWLGWLDIVARQRARAGRAARASRRRCAPTGSATLSCSAWAARASGPRCWPRCSRRRRATPSSWSSTRPTRLRCGPSRRGSISTRTLFIVSSKSGTTLEPNILYAHFLARAGARPGTRAGRPLRRDHRPGLAARERRRGRPASAASSTACPRSAAATRCCRISAWCRRRFSASISRLPRARGATGRRRAAPRCRPRTTPAWRWAWRSARRPAPAATRSRWSASPPLWDFGAWLEQLLAESTGKQGRGLIPVDGEELGAPAVYGDDRLFVHLRVESAAGRGAGRARRGPGRRRPSGREARHRRPRWSWAASSSAGSWRPRPPARRSASIPSISPTSRRARWPRARLTAEVERTGALPEERPLLSEAGLSSTPTSATRRRCARRWPAPPASPACCAPTSSGCGPATTSRSSPTWR